MLLPVKEVDVNVRHDTEGILLILFRRPTAMARHGFKTLRQERLPSR